MTQQTKGTFGGDIVPSVSITNLVNQREAVLERIERIFDLIHETQAIANSAGVGMPTFDLELGSYNDRLRVNGSVATERDQLAKAAQHIVDATAWQYLMTESGMRSLMDAQARKDWDKSIIEHKFPELTVTNIRATFEALHASRSDIFERGVINCFKSLSWCYRTHNPFRFGKRIIVRYLRHTYRAKDMRHFGSFNYEACNKLDDLVRVFSILDGKPEPDYRHAVRAKLDETEKTTHCADLEYFSIKWFYNGNGHVTFKRLDLVEKLNEIIARHYPGALPHSRHAA